MMLPYMIRQNRVAGCCYIGSTAALCVDEAVEAVNATYCRSKSIYPICVAVCIRIRYPPAWPTPAPMLSPWRGLFENSMQQWDAKPLICNDILTHS
jgi:hypothetical protein